MTKQEINNLCREGWFSGNANQPEVVETHISWVILCSKSVYKIKKPVHYSFLDFSTLEKRKYYCDNCCSRKPCIYIEVPEYFNDQLQLPRKLSPGKSIFFPDKYYPGWSFKKIPSQSIQKEVVFVQWLYFAAICRKFPGKGTILLYKATAGVWRCVF